MRTYGTHHVRNSWNAKFSRGYPSKATGDCTERATCECPRKSTLREVTNLGRCHSERICNGGSKALRLDFSIVEEARKPGFASRVTDGGGGTLLRRSGGLHSNRWGILIGVGVGSGRIVAADCSTSTRPRSSTGTFRRCANSTRTSLRATLGVVATKPAATTSSGSRPTTAAIRAHARTITAAFSTRAFPATFGVELR